MKLPTEITPEELEVLPRYHHRERIIVIDSPGKLKSFEQEIPDDRLIGIDTETRPSFRKGVRHQCALIQLAFESSTYLFRLNRIGLPESIRNILADQNITKVGIAIADDLKELRELSEFEPAGFVDLNTTCSNIGFVSIGAKKLTGIVLNKRISKRQQTSNWEATSLSEAQVEYAAIDARICRNIFMRLQELQML